MGEAVKTALRVLVVDDKANIRTLLEAALSGEGHAVSTASNGDKAIAMLEAQGFDGCHEVEIFSRDNWWRRDPGEVLRTCIERHRAC